MQLEPVKWRFDMYARASTAICKRWLKAGKRHSSAEKSLRIGLAVGPKYCPECRDINEYLVRHIAIDPTDPVANIRLAHELACPFCSTWSDLEFTTEAKLAISAEIVKLTADNRP